MNEGVGLYDRPLQFNEFLYCRNSPINPLEQDYVEPIGCFLTD